MKNGRKYYKDSRSVWYLWNNVLSVCQAHGEAPNEIRDNRNLKYLPADDADMLFCALLLRLGDLLDFDDTRAPRVLFNYAINNEKSIEEIKNIGFRLALVILIRLR